MTDIPERSVEQEIAASIKERESLERQEKIFETIRRYQAGTGRPPSDMELELWRHYVEVELEKAKRLAMAVAGIKP